MTTFIYISYKKINKKFKEYLLYIYIKYINQEIFGNLFKYSMFMTGLRYKYANINILFNVM